MFDRVLKREREMVHEKRLKWRNVSARLGAAEYTCRNRRMSFSRGTS